MGDNTDASRLRAEARTEKLRKASQEGAAVWAQYEASRVSLRERTSSLRELRLAKEALEAEVVAAAPVRTAAKKRRIVVKA